MARVSVEIHPGEAQTFLELFNERDAVNKAITVLTLSVCRREGIKAATLIHVEEASLTLDVPDGLTVEDGGAPLKLDRQESSKMPGEAPGVISAAPKHENAPEGKPDGPRPVIEAPGESGNGASSTTTTAHEHPYHREG